MSHWIVLVAACSLVGCASAGNVRARSDSLDAAPAGCVNQTDSLIPHPGSACTGFGHSYSKTDIDRTGETTVGGALRYLDPTITVSR
jgi:hypothetical protein